MSKFSQFIQKQKQHSSAKKQGFNLEAMTNANRKKVACPCGSKKSYKICCEPIHKNIMLAQSPLQLMRSRYTAFVLGNVDYLIQSHHSSTRPLNEKKDILTWTTSVDWKGLQIIEISEVVNHVGYVTFVALFLEHGYQKKIDEKSRFVKENGHWVYIDGIEKQQS